MNEVERGRALAWYAKQWVGAKEIGGQNRGQIVEMFQRAVDGKAQGEPWCMAFVQFCLMAIDALCDDLTLTESVRHHVWKAEHCVTVWNLTPKACRHTKPQVGDLAIWQMYDAEGKPTTSGHTGIVEKVLDEQNFGTVEGNTGVGNQREGDGVALKNRNTQGMGNLRLLGFLRPWATVAETGGQ